MSLLLLFNQPGRSVNFFLFGSFVPDNTATSVPVDLPSYNTSNFAVEPASGPISATFSVTEAGDTLASASALALSATLAVTEAGDTLASASALGLTGSASISEAADGAAAVGTLPIAGTTSLTEANDSAAAAGSLPIVGVAAIAEAGDNLASAGILALAANATVTEAGDALASATALDLAATAAITETGDTLSSAETLSSTATAAITEAGDVLSATATMGLAATTAITVAGAGGVLGVGEKRYSPPNDKPAVRKANRKATQNHAVVQTAAAPLAEAITPLPTLYIGALLRTPEPPLMAKPATAAWGIAEDEAEIEMLLLLAA